MADTPVLPFDPWLAEQPDRQPLEEKRHEHDAAKDRLTKNAAKGGELKQRYQYKSGTELRVEQDRGDEQAIRRVVREAQRLAAELEEQDAVTEGLQAPEYRADQACKAVERPFRLRHGTQLAEAGATRSCIPRGGQHLRVESQCVQAARRRVGIPTASRADRTLTARCRGDVRHHAQLNRDNESRSLGWVAIPSRARK